MKTEATKLNKIIFFKRKNQQQQQSAKTSSNNKHKNAGIFKIQCVGKTF